MKVTRDDKSGFTAKDWITLTISLVALMISAISSYFNTFQKAERVAVTMRDIAKPYRNVDRLVVRQDDEHSVIFINSGNRPVTIVAMHILFVQHRDPKTFACLNMDNRGPDSGEFETTLAPFVIKENEVVIKTFKIGPRSPDGVGRITGADASSFGILEELKRNEEISLEVCLSFEMSTPTVRNHNAVVSMYKVVVTPRGTFWSWPGPQRFDNTPSTLIDQTTLRFW